MNSYFRATSRIACQLVLTLSALAASAGVCLAGAEITLYDVDFDGPPHVVGMTPAFGFGSYPRITPTSGGGHPLFPFGSTTVVPFASPLVNRPVQIMGLDGTPNDPGRLGGADLQFDLSDPQLSWIDRFHASVDVYPENVRTATGLGIFFDAASIHSVQFMPDGNIRVRDATGLDQIVGQHIPETIYHVRMAFDKSTVQWSASINGVPVYSGPAHDIDMERFRISMTTGDTDSPCTAYVDNILVTADVPEPSTICLAGVALSGVGVFAARRSRRLLSNPSPLGRG
jgi:hypothetical protein